MEYVKATNYLHYCAATGNRPPLQALLQGVTACIHVFISSLLMEDHVDANSPLEMVAILKQTEGSGDVRVIAVATRSLSRSERSRSLENSRTGGRQATP